jgi:hypothetical protein
MTKVLSDLRYDCGGRYRFVLSGDYVVGLGLGLKGYHELVDGRTVWATLEDDKLTIMAGYAFDGCSPAWRVLGKWYGTPTPRKAVGPAAVHDCLRGYMKLACLRITRKNTDDVFWNMLKAEGFQLGDVYHGAVSGPLGDVYSYFTAARPSKASCACHPA